jgi:hypothetical protein
MPDEYAERWKEFSSIAHGNGEAIVGDWMDVGNVERGRAGEKVMGVRGGIAIAIPSALVATRLIASMLFGISINDPAYDHRRCLLSSWLRCWQDFYKLGVLPG